MLSIALLIVTFLLVLSMMFNVVYAFTFKITVWVRDASDYMGKAKVFATVKEKGHDTTEDKGVTKSKVVDIGKMALQQDESDFVVAKFDQGTIKNSRVR